MPQAKRNLLDYIRKCPQCALCKKPKHKPFGELQIVQQPTEVFQVICLDFIRLPESQSFNALLKITDKFSRAVWLVPGKETWSAEEWADAFFSQVLKAWGLPKAVVSDRDPKDFLPSSTPSSCSHTMREVSFSLTHSRNSASCVALSLKSDTTNDNSTATTTKPLKRRRRSPSQKEKSRVIKALYLSSPVFQQNGN
ncbi:predicted protein [Aspergillus udagawae]|uniref:Integrase catalytic domain-containing protein n=1 Tax=Aspergillus udagawae TaxID=91492 RepID=A0A8H3N1U3_9EURO|nr:predicted protein [Aspergillus udagawae]